MPSWRLFALYQKAAVLGLLTVGTITKDYEYEMLERGRCQSDRVQAEHQGGCGERTGRSPGGEDRGFHPHSRSPSARARDKLSSTWERLRELYEEAYGSCPATNDGAEKVFGWQMREHIRSWITAWDLRRLDPSYRPAVEVDRIGDDYVEDHVMEESSDSDDDEEATG